MALQTDDEFCGIRTVHQNLVRQVRDKAPPTADLDRMAQTFKLLGDPTRLKIVMALRDVELCVCDIAAYLCLSESAVSHQLRRLKDLALVKNRREGQILYYTLNDDHVSALLDMSRQHIHE